MKSKFELSAEKKIKFCFLGHVRGLIDVYRLIYKESIQLQDVEGFGKFNFCVS